MVLISIVGRREAVFVVGVLVRYGPSLYPELLALTAGRKMH